MEKEKHTNQQERGHVFLALTIIVVVTVALLGIWNFVASKERSANRQAANSKNLSTIHPNIPTNSEPEHYDLDMGTVQENIKKRIDFAVYYPGVYDPQQQLPSTELTQMVYGGRKASPAEPFVRTRINNYSIVEVGPGTSQTALLKDPDCKTIPLHWAQITAFGAEKSIGNETTIRCSEAGKLSDRTPIYTAATGSNGRPNVDKVYYLVQRNNTTVILTCRIGPDCKPEDSQPEKVLPLLESLQETDKKYLKVVTYSDDKPVD